MDLSEAARALAALGRRADPGGGRVTLSLEGPVARLVLDHPRARGAMTFQMMEQLAGAVQRLASWDGAVILLSSSDPRAFCAGGHLGQVRQAVTDGEAAAGMAEAMGGVLDGLLALPAVSVAVIEGPAVGGGAEVATATDLRVLGPNARIHFVHARLGIAPGWGGARRLERLVGRRRALRILLDAQAIGPEDALSLGLADEVAPDAALAAEVLVGRWLDRAPEAVRAVKRQLTTPSEATAAFASVWGGPAHRAALEALARHR